MDTGGPAFPRGTPYGTNIEPGMTLRDWLAGQALIGLLAEEGVEEGFFEGDARRCYLIADAMIAEKRATEK